MGARRRAGGAAAFSDSFLRAARGSQAANMMLGGMAMLFAFMVTTGSVWDSVWEARNGAKSWRALERNRVNAELERYRKEEAARAKAEAAAVRKHVEAAGAAAQPPLAAAGASPAADAPSESSVPPVASETPLSTAPSSPPSVAGAHAVDP